MSTMSGKRKYDAEVDDEPEETNLVSAGKQMARFTITDIRTRKTRLAFLHGLKWSLEIEVDQSKMAVGLVLDSAVTFEDYSADYKLSCDVMMRSPFEHEKRFVTSQIEQSIVKKGSFGTRKLVLNPFSFKYPLRIDLELELWKPPHWYPKLVKPRSIVDFLFVNRSTAGKAKVMVEGEEFDIDANLLLQQAPALHGMIHEDEEGGKDFNRPIPLDQKVVGKEAFQMVLNFLYARSGTTRNVAWNNEEKAISFVKTANYLGCINMKLYGESILTYRHLKVENAPRLLMLAEETACALLKEGAMDICVQEYKTASAQPHWPLVMATANLASEIIGKMAPSSNEDEKSPADDKSTSSMDVRSLRMRLEAVGQEVDGTKEALIERLKALTMKDTKTAASK